MIGLIDYFPGEWRDMIKNNICEEHIYREVRIRVNNPLILRSNKGETIVEDKALHRIPQISSGDIHEIFEAVNEYSVYAHMDSIKQGFITVKGGHRIGFCGHAVVDDGKIKNMNGISSINMRISQQIKGIANSIISSLVDDNGVVNTLIVSPPGRGKTTLLREIVRMLSNGDEQEGQINKGYNISVIDERSEIAAMYDGIPGNDLGMRTDVIDGIGKSEGISIMLKTMSPEVIALDEIGSREDMLGIRKAIKSGCSVIATAHGNSLDDVRNNLDLKEVCRKGFFERYIVIKKVGDYCILG